MIGNTVLVCIRTTLSICATCKLRAFIVFIGYTITICIRTTLQYS